MIIYPLYLCLFVILSYLDFIKEIEKLSVILLDFWLFYVNIDRHTQVVIIIDYNDDSGLFFLSMK